MQTLTPSTSLLLDAERLPLFPSAIAASLGRVVVIAPHPDDESLGCGGLLALLADSDAWPQVIVMTDGARSHPNSPSYPPVRLAALREKETLAALTALGLPNESAHFLRYPDCGLAEEEMAATAQLKRLFDALAPNTILAPWRRDPHCDHVAAWRLARAATRELTKRPRWLEYPVWAWTQVEGEAAPRAEEARAWRINISSVLARKTAAIKKHRSQTGALIHDDPDGFTLSPEMLAHFAQPWELLLEPNDG